MYRLSRYLPIAFLVRRAGVETLLCHTLNVTQHVNFLTTREAYDDYVKYWNRKCQ